MANRNITIEGARIFAKNFRGEKKASNPNGNRSFCVIIESEMARTLQADGWNIKWLDPQKPEDDPQAFLPVTVRFDKVPPKVIMITSEGQVRLDENTVEALDWADLDQNGGIDLIITPYNWELNGCRGVKAMLKTGYFTIQEDELDRKHRNSAVVDDEPF